MSNVGEDMISIYDAHLGSDGPPLWRKVMSNGLSGKAPLVEELRKDIDAAIAAQQQQKKP
jgi:hypothetical protein